MKHKIFYDEAVGAVRLKLFGPVSAEDAAQFLTQIESLYADKEHRYIITDHTESREVMTKETRKEFKNMGSKATFERHAIVGTTPVTRIATKVIMAVLGQLKTTKFFDTDEEAVAWIKGEVLTKAKTRN